MSFAESEVAVYKTSLYKRRIAMDRMKGITRALTVFSGLILLAGCGSSGDGARATQVSGAGGEVRGQIDTTKGAFTLGNSALSALLTGDQVLPTPVTTSASGIGTVTLDATTKKLSGVLVTTGVIGTLAHIHDSADASIVVTLEGGPTVWTLPDSADAVLSAAEEAKLNAGQLYFAVHSAANPGGEIRGSINAKVRVSLLSGANEVPAVTTSATGTGVLAFDPITNAIRGFVKTTGITGTAAHIHEGAAGVNGPNPITLTNSGGGVWTVPAGAILTPTQIALFDAGNLYFNVHSTANAGGEIRGQILPSTMTVKTASLSGNQEVPPFPTSATGTGILTLDSVRKVIAGSVKTTGVTGIAAHVHEAAVGVNGDVKVTLAETPAGSGVWLVPDNSPLTDALVSSFNAGNLYFNVHSNNVVTY